MSNQYTVYSSSDAGGPGLITGAANTLNVILKACLVDGYPGKAAAGWTQPIAPAGNISSYKLGAGSSGLACVINDNGPNVTSTYREAWITGWETVLGVGAPVGTGTGQFPTPAQLLATGHAVIRKSVSADALTRAWQLFADAHSAIMFIATGDVAGVYQAFYFGDIFSIKSTADNYRCMLVANATENSANAGVLSQQNSVGSVISGHFIARTYGGGGASITAGKQGDVGKSSAATTLDGIVQAPNGPNNSYFLAEITAYEVTGAVVRGRLRGLYQACHAKATFADGQVITGAGDFAGKTFQVVRDVQSSTGNCHLLVETSATLETN